VVNVWIEAVFLNLNDYLVTNYFIIKFTILELCSYFFISLWGFFSIFVFNFRNLIISFEFNFDPWTYSFSIGCPHCHRTILHFFWKSKFTFIFSWNKCRWSLAFFISIAYNIRDILIINQFTWIHLTIIYDHQNKYNIIMM
jgi:hypothetical protein